MVQNKKINVALTIAGSDSGGGAGIAADLKTFFSLGVHGTCVMTCLTAQNPKAVSRVQPCAPGMVRAQIEAVFSELPPKAVKTGMLYSASIVREVAETLKDLPKTPLVIDPVMIATSGATLAKNSAVKAMIRELFPLATLLTPNVPEAEVLLGRKIKSLEALFQAAADIYNLFDCTVLIKGGHFKIKDEAIDFLFDGKKTRVFQAPYLEKIKTHGTGCTFSAAITAYLTLGRSLPQAVELAKAYITQAIARHSKTNGHAVLSHGHSQTI